jgi:hypothetical protein
MEGLQIGRPFMSEPEWLRQHGGALARGANGESWFVMFDGQPLYRLTPIPARGQFGCALTQTNNGRRLPCERIAATGDAALQAGLEELAKIVGWAS